MTTDADLRRLAEQMIVDEDVAAILALLNERERMAVERDEQARWRVELAKHADAAERRVAALTDALASAEARVSGLEEGLQALDEPLQWLNDHYHKAMVEMPTHLFRRFDKARAALAAADASAGGGGSASTEAEE